jgi:hypothetical protein
MRALAVFILLIVLTGGCKKTVVPPFEAGAAVAEITPPAGFLMYRGESTGVTDPLYARALVFRQGEIRGAILVCDLIGIPRDIGRMARERAAKKTGIPFQNITVTATHTHTGPSIKSEITGYAERESSGKLTGDDSTGYITYLINSLTEAIVSADRRAGEVEMTSGKGYLPGISFNRRFLMTDGRVRTNPGYLNPRIVGPVGPVDPEVNFILFNPAGKSSFSASLTVFAIHADTRGGTKFSADYPCYIHKKLGDFFGDQLVSVFGNGPCGNINHVDAMHGKPADMKVTFTEEIGTEIAGAVNEALPQAVKNKPDLAIASGTIYLPLQDYTDAELQWSKEGEMPLYNEREFLERRRKLKISVWEVQPPLEQMRKFEAVPPSVSGDPWRLPVEIHVFRLDKNTAIVTMPGELFSEFGIDLKKRSPFANTMLIELANADIAYVPVKQAFMQGDYETVNSRLAPGSGEKMIDTAVEMLNGLKNSSRQ